MTCRAPGWLLDVGRNVRRDRDDGGRPKLASPERAGKPSQRLGIAPQHCSRILQTHMACSVNLTGCPMLQAVRQSVPFAIGVVVIAAPLLTIALVLATSATRRVSSMFVIGWAAGVMTVLGVIVAFVDTTVPSRGISPRALAVIRIGLGTILAFLAFRAATAAARPWRQRRAGGAVTPPAMIRNLASWSARRSFITGFSLSSVNPKNVAPTAAGAAAILDASQAPLEQAFAIIVFTIIASLGIAIPTLLSAFGGQQISSAPVRPSGWMTSQAETISAIVLTVLGVVLLVKGIGGG